MTPTNPPLGITLIASYYGAPVTFERDMSTFEDDEQWLPATGIVDAGMLLELQSGTVRNVQLQLRGIEDMTYDEHYNLFIEAVGVFMGDLTIRNTPKECLQITGEVRAGVTKTLTIWADGEWAIECNKNDGPLLNVVAAINYLRSIQIDIDKLGVARKEGAR